ncbi:MAG: ATP:cob(I)alamin adenosyltransferase, partial [Planctomycetota bacterium]
MRITKVYTRSGDDGSTRLGGGQKVEKDSLRIASYGTVDELNSVIGVVIADGVDPAAEPRVRDELLRVQNELFDLGSDLCILEEDKAKYPVPRIEPRHVDALEK